MKFHASYVIDGISRAMLIEAPSKEIAQALFVEKYPDATFYVVREATCNDEKPGKPTLCYEA